MSNVKNRSVKNRDRASLPAQTALSAALVMFLAGNAAGFTQPGKIGGQPAQPAAPSAAKVFGSAPAAPVAQPNTPPSKAPADPVAAGESEANVDSVVRVDDNLVVDLHVNDEDLVNVLQMLSIQSQKNIVASNNVSAKVKADLYGVTFYEALDAILHVNGYGYLQKGNFVYVYTLDELEKIEKATRVRVSKVIKLGYLNAIDAAEFVKPLLSEGGQIKTNGKTGDFSVGSTPVGKDDFANDSMLVVYDYEENVAEIEKLCKEIDSKPAQVLVEATILQTQLNEGNAFGVDFSLIGDLNFLDFAGGGGPLSAVDGMIAGAAKGYKNGSSGTFAVPDDDKGRALTSTPGNTAGPGTFKVGVTASDVSVFLRLLDEATDTTILSNPKLLTLNRQGARVLVGRKVGYLNTTSTDTTTTQSVEFLDTGTQLSVRPFVTTDGLIRMELKPQVSEAVIRDARDATGAAVTIPDEITNEMATNVMVRDGQTVVLGGLFRESTQATRRQVPFLGDVPILGAAFRGHEDETQRSEIIFLITPSIVNDDVLVTGGKEAKNYVETARTGARDGLLPWSRDKMASQRLIDAQKYAAEGKVKEAEWKINQALSLNPAQADAIRMRERLTGEVRKYPNRSLLEHIMHEEARSTAQGGAGEGEWTTAWRAYRNSENNASTTSSEFGGSTQGQNWAEAEQNWSEQNSSEMDQSQDGTVSIEVSEGEMGDSEWNNEAPAQPEFVEPNGWQPTESDAPAPEQNDAPADGQDSWSDNVQPGDSSEPASQPASEPAFDNESTPSDGGSAPSDSSDGSGTSAAASDNTQYEQMVDVTASVEASAPAAPTAAETNHEATTSESAPAASANTSGSAGTGSAPVSGKTSANAGSKTNSKSAKTSRSNGWTNSWSRPASTGNSGTSQASAQTGGTTESAGLDNFVIEASSSDPQNSAGDVAANGTASVDPNAGVFWSQTDSTASASSSFSNHASNHEPVLSIPGETGDVQKIDLQQKVARAWYLNGKKKNATSRGFSKYRTNLPAGVQPIVTPDSTPASSDQSTASVETETK